MIVVGLCMREGMDVYGLSGGRARVGKSTALVESWQELKLTALRGWVARVKIVYVLLGG